MPDKFLLVNKNYTDHSRRGFIQATGALALLNLLPGFSVAQESSSDSLSLRIMSCNIRVALDEDETKGVGWSKRKQLCLDIISNHRPGIICLQEVLKNQSEDFIRHFSSYQLLGFDGPEMDAHKTGYHGIAKNPILFDKKQFILLSAGTYWLSETPLIAGSLSWNSARARHANWVRLKDKKTGKEFRVVNLHLDHIAESARQQQIALVLKEADQYQKDFPQLLAGDFNAKPSSEVVRKVLSADWKDAHAELHGNIESEFTVHEFKGLDYPKAKEKGKIDFVFYKGGWKPIASKIITDHKNGQYPSDHFFLLTDLVID